MSLEIYEMKPEKQYKNIHDVLNNWTKKKPYQTKQEMYIWLNKINTANAINTEFKIDPNEIQLQIPIYRKSGGYNGNENNLATIIDVCSPENNITAISTIGSKNILKKENLTIGKTKTPKWFYAYGLNGTHETIPWINDIDTIIITAPKNTILTKNDIPPRIEQKEKRDAIRHIETMNRYIHDEYEHLKQIDKTLELWQLPQRWNNIMEFTEKTPITTHKLDSLNELYQTQKYNIPLSKINEILIQ